MESDRDTSMALGTRVVIATSVAVSVVLIGLILVVRASFSAAVAAREAERLGSTAHHLAEMVARAQADDAAEIEAIVRAVQADLELFDFRVEWAPTGQPGRESDTVTVALVDAPGVIRVAARTSAVEDLENKLLWTHVVLVVVTLATIVGAVHLSVHWSLRRPMKRIQKQLRHMRRGRWAAEAALGGPREISELAHELETVGKTVEDRVTTWVEAERRAAYERARVELKRRLIPPARDLNLTAGQLVAAGSLDARGVRRARRMLRAADEILDTVDAPGATRSET